MSPSDHGRTMIRYHIAVCANLFINNVYKYLYITSFVVVICLPVSGAMENNTCYYQNSYTPTHNTIWFTIGYVQFLYTQMNERREKKTKISMKKSELQRREKLTRVRLGHTYCTHVRLRATGSKREFGNNWECSIFHSDSIPSSETDNEKIDKIRKYPTV